MIGYVLTFALFYALSKSKKRASLGKLPGERIKWSDLYRKIRNREAGDINNGDLYFDGGFVYDSKGKIYDSKEALKEEIEKTLKKNQYHLRAARKSTSLLSYNDYFGFNNILPTNEREAFNFTVFAIANGQKFIWEDQGVRRGLESEIFGRKSQGERKAYKNIISKDGITIEELNERFSLEEDYRAAIINALMTVNSRAAASNYLIDSYNKYVTEYIKQKTYNTQNDELQFSTDEERQQTYNTQNENELPFNPDEEDPPFWVFFLVSKVPDHGTFFFFSPTLKNFLHFICKFTIIVYLCKK